MAVTKDFLLDAGTNGFIAAVFSMMTTELNTLANGAAATSSVIHGTGVLTQADFANAIEFKPIFLGGGAFTPTAGGCLSCWWDESPDGGSTFETAISTPSSTVPALGKAPDFIIPVYEGGAAWASNNFRMMTPFRVSYASTKLIVQNNSGVSLPASGNIIKAVAGAWGY